MSNWAIEAIEREAMNRVSRQWAEAMMSGGDYVTLFGLTSRQILWLKGDYERRTGALARDIKPIQKSSPGRPVECDGGPQP